MDTAYTKEEWETLKRFIENDVSAHADAWDAAQATPRELINELGRRNLLAGESAGEVSIPTFGRICQLVGAASMSLLSLLTVHGMAQKALSLWGRAEQQEKWLSQLACGNKLGAFALTEPTIGSDANHIQCHVVEDDGETKLVGKKSWISYAQIADAFLVFARWQDRPTALWIPADSPGVSIEPIQDMLGFRASMMGHLNFHHVPVDESCIVGRKGFGISHVALSALDLGRFAIANGCVGLTRACLNSSLKRATERIQFDSALLNKQLIQKMLSEMDCDLSAAALLCDEAARLRADGDPNSIIETAKAKYFASRIAFQAADRAVQIHGASGCSSDHPIQRFFRDARIPRIIEGSDQMQELMIASNLRPSECSPPAPLHS